MLVPNITAAFTAAVCLSGSAPLSNCSTSVPTNSSSLYLLSAYSTSSSDVTSSSSYSSSAPTITTPVQTVTSTRVAYSNSSSTQLDITHSQNVSTSSPTVSATSLPPYSNFSAALASFNASSTGAPKFNSTQNVTVSFLNTTLTQFNSSQNTIAPILNATVHPSNVTISNSFNKFRTSFLAAAAAAPELTTQKAVFAHYMVGTVYPDHAHMDIDSAAAIGLDGFALNIGDPAQPFVRETLNYMFDYARDNHPNFYLFISMDTWATKAGGNTLEVFTQILADFKGHAAYYKGPNGFSFVSTFSDGGFTNTIWSGYWANNFANEVYFLPNFDHTDGYWLANGGWYYYWGDVINGLFSWDSIWPDRNQIGAGDMSKDQIVVEGTSMHNKTYMIGLSALQYKNSYDTNYYREGELNLPIRMDKILSMDPSPNYTQIVSWNDGPESHYIGWLWLEQNNDTQPMKYANQAQWSHLGWQPTITSFIEAFKAGKQSSEMRPPSNKIAVGALWYKTMLQSSVCPDSGNRNPATTKYQEKTDGWDTGLDNLNWMLVAPSDPAGMVIQLISNGAVIARVPAQAGFNYGAAGQVQAGYQRMELLDSSGNVLLAASGGRCVSAGCPDCIYNMNYQVLELAGDTGALGNCPYLVCKKAVFAHYMIGNVNPDHAHQDIDDAAAMGLDGFALNIGDPAQPFVRQSLNYMFDYTRDNHPDFKLFISMDTWATKAGGNFLNLFDSILRDFKGHDAYYKGPNGASFISTFSDGGFRNDEWMAWKQSFGNDMYFVPNFDHTLGYNTTDPGWWAYWGDVVDGLFSWEFAWPQRAQYDAGDITLDGIVRDGAALHLKSYMMPLSPLQYKNAYETNYYREGELNLVKKMENILSMKNPPDFVQVISWNDGPESHYIGNLWLEQNNDTQPMKYANSHWSHKGWQPLITSFTQAFKAGLPASSMVPPTGVPAVGAIWYHTILQSAVCPNEGQNNYTKKPDGFTGGLDNLNWAVVLPNDPAGMQIRVLTNGAPQVFAGRPGLNYGAIPIQAGIQRMEVLDGAGGVILAAAGGRCVSAGCPDCIYNMNYQVVELNQPGPDNGKCPYAACSNSVFAHYMVGNVIPEHAQKDIDDAAAMGLDGFALNVGDPAQDFVTNTFNYMFDYTLAQHPNFKLFISLDLWAEGTAYGGTNLAAYTPLFQKFMNHGAWLKGPNGAPFISSFSSGGLKNTDWIDWRKSFNDNVYLVPDFDDTRGYNTSDPGWWGYWGDVIDGAMSWETAWPNPGVTTIGSVDVDQVVASGMDQHQKSYMMPLSSLQYKNAYDTNYYREGELNLPMRMENLLNMNPVPAFVEVLTWNDGPESHYIGNLWTEQNNDTQPAFYSSQAEFPHTGWQPLITSFIGAYKAGKKAKDMAPPPGEIAVGSLWYKTILQTAVCPISPDSATQKYSAKPDGFGAGVDQLNWAVVIPPGISGPQVRVISGGKVIAIVPLKGGLNYGAAAGAQAGAQRLELIDVFGDVLLAASGGRCISDGCPDCVYNMNPQVVAMGPDTKAVGRCPVQKCASIPNPLADTSGWSSDMSGAATWASENGQKCVKRDCGQSCLSNEVHVSTALGCGQPICCPPDAVPSCTWRGGESGDACHGQCHPDEVTLFYDVAGDGRACLPPGLKAFCCVTSTYSRLIKSCKYAGCGESCDAATQEQVATKYDPQTCEYSFGFSGPQDRPLCCPKGSGVTNCHWVGQGTCDDNMCSDTDLTLDNDPYGDSDSMCALGLNGRLKTLCCNAPSKTNLFLPVELERLFPTLPPPADIPKWNIVELGPANIISNTITVLGGPNKQAFGFILIDGPPGTLASLSKRDGSHYEFLSCPTGEERQSVRVVCMDESENSNCNDIFLDGVEGTIIRMPDGCGDGMYAVAHDLRLAEDQKIPLKSIFARLSKPQVMELDLSYDFGLVGRVKRGAGDIYIRVDYSNVAGYWDLMVNSPAAKKRDLFDKRFVSSSASTWKSRFDTLRSSSDRTPLSESLDKSIYGEKKTCVSIDDSYVEMSMTGSVDARSQWGFTFVGTIFPFHLEQAYGFFDNDITIQATVNVQTHGAVNINNATGVVFPSEITAKGFSQPGLVRFRPTLQVGIDIQAAIEMEADFRVKIYATTVSPIQQAYPSVMGPATGSTKFDFGQFDGDGVRVSTDGTFRLSLLPTVSMDFAFSSYGSGSSSSTLATNEQISAFFQTYIGLRVLSQCATFSGGISQPFYALTTAANTQSIWAGDDVSTNIVPGSSSKAMSLSTLCRRAGTKRRVARDSGLVKRKLPNNVQDITLPFILVLYNHFLACSPLLDADSPQAPSTGSCVCQLPSLINRAGFSPRPVLSDGSDDNYKRHILESWDMIEGGPYGAPSAAYMFQGILIGNMRYLYTRIIRYDRGRDGIIEVAFRIPQGVTGDSYRSMYNDNFYVVHIHVAHLYVDPLDGMVYPGVLVVNHFHGQTWDTTANRVNGFAQDGDNQRSTVHNCRLASGPLTFIYPGSNAYPATCPDTLEDQIILRFLHYLYRVGWIDGNIFTGSYVDVDGVTREVPGARDRPVDNYVYPNWNGIWNGETTSFVPNPDGQSNPFPQFVPPPWWYAPPPPRKEKKNSIGSASDVDGA